MKLLEVLLMHKEIEDFCDSQINEYVNNPEYSQEECDVIKRDFINVKNGADLMYKKVLKKLLVESETNS